jgi:acyl-CoA synthetase (AMP-forming)/AMP-acid ligase II
VARPRLGETDRGAATSVVGYTSGTTGFPKGALWSNDHFLAHIMRWGWEFGLSGEQVMLVPGPLFHLSYAGLSLAALGIGARVRIMPEFSAELALDELTHHASFAFLVPSMTGLVAEEWRRRGEPEVPAFRFMISSGAPGPLSLTRTAMAMFQNARIAEAYGWTEGGWVTFEVKAEETLLAHSVGWPTFGNEVLVFDEAGRPCPVGEAGEVGVRSLTHFSGYLGRPEETEAAWQNGYVMSGDVGIWQPDGRLCIVDRKKDMIISGGENVYTAEVERILHEHPEVLEAAVVGLPDERWGELVTAMVVPREGAPTAAAIEAFCRKRLAGYKVPRRIEVVAELPRNSMGKVQKFRIIEALAGTGEGEAG